MRAAEVRVNTVLSPAISPVYSTRMNMHFDMTGTQRSFVYSTTMSLLSCYTESLPCPLLETANRPRRGDRLLSHIEMRGTKTLTRNANKKQNQNQNATRYIHRLIYWLAIVRQRKGRFPGQMPEYHLLNE